MPDNNRKKRGFFSRSDAVRMASLMSGVAGIRKTQGIIRDSVGTILHGDIRQSQWTASIPREKRIPLVRRLRIEGMLFIVLIGMFFPLSCMLMNSDDAWVVPGGALFWGALSALSFLTGNGVGLLKFWQSACVEQGSPIPFRHFIRHFWSGSPHGG